MSYLECPYCEKELKDPDDCHETDRVYEYECNHCEKGFVFRLDYTVNYYEEKAPCLNGGPHNFRKCEGFPIECFKDKWQCRNCEKIVISEKYPLNNVSERPESEVVEHRKGF